MSTTSIVLGIDVGTSSVRVLAMDDQGLQVAMSTHPISMWNPMMHFYEQSSYDIIDAIRLCICQVQSDLRKGEIRYEVVGLGVDATCSLVLVTEDGDIDLGGRINDNPTDIIMWMDHRAVKQANFINDLGHKRLKNVGGKISPEMQPPKLLWLKENESAVFNKVDHFMDLADFITFKLTGSYTRSICCVVCKWLFNSGPLNSAWDDSFWRSIGLGDLCHGNKIGTVVQSPGSEQGVLSSDMAAYLSLPVNIPVAVSLIDAHAGSLATIACNASFLSTDLARRLCMIAGSSTCHLFYDRDERFVEGVWGPYYGAVFDNLWLGEAGQSAVGLILDMVVQQFSHRIPEMQRLDGLTQQHIWVQGKIDEQVVQNGWTETMRATHDLHIWPDYNGNRSPLARPDLKAAVVGLALVDQDPINDLIKTYIATTQSLALMTRFIVDRIQSCRSKEQFFDTIVMSGGLSKSNLYVQVHADVTNLPIIIPKSDEVVARGAAMLGACAAKWGDMKNVAFKYTTEGVGIDPKEDLKEFYEKKYQSFLLIGQLQEKIIDIMK